MKATKSKSSQMNNSKGDGGGTQKSIFLTTEKLKFGNESFFHIVGRNKTYSRHLLWKLRKLLQIAAEK